MLQGQCCIQEFAVGLHFSCDNEQASSGLLNSDWDWNSSRGSAKNFLHNVPIRKSEHGNACLQWSVRLQCCLQPG